MGDFVGTGKRNRPKCVSPSGAGVSREEKTDGELASAPKPVASDLDASPMEMNKVLRDGKPDTKPRRGTVLECRLGLREQVEDSRKNVGRYSDAIVLDAHHRVFVLLGYLHPDRSIVFDEFGGILQEIEKHLAHPRRIDVHE